ncbi:MAG: alpha/beta fold hydrolase [Actinobacteria bacterium]|nr:alpha/beta fold hydrolase [Actinomycetota bacterium]
MPVVDVNGARLWYDEAGQGEVVVLLHGGLGDSGLWEPIVPFLAERFRVLRVDFRFFGRSAGPFAPFSFAGDTVGVLDELGIERAALVGLSLGGSVAFDVALEHPERVWAVAGVAPGLSGHVFSVGDELEAAYEAAEDVETVMALDFQVWAPLGVEERFVRLWRETPDADPLPPGVEALPPRVPATERIGELAVPALVVTVTHDPPDLREVASLVPGAGHVELDSDHYVTLREPEAVARVLLDFLESA